MDNFSIFVSHGKNHTILRQVKQILDSQNLRYFVSIDEETTGIPVLHKVLKGIKQCQAAIVCVTADQRMEDGSYILNTNVAIEIGAIFNSFGDNVIPLWDRRVVVPSNIEGFYRCEFEGDRLSPMELKKLRKSILELKKPLYSKFITSGRNLQTIG